MTDSKHTPDGAPLSKEERKVLLAQLESTSSRTEPPEQQLQRAQQALRSGNLTQARRLLDQMVASHPHLPGLDYFREQLQGAEQDHKRSENVRTAEEMLTRYIQQRKKRLAELALDTLADLVPQHPRLPEYRIWVQDLDQEVALQQRLDALLQEGRDALRREDFDAARRQLDALGKLDPDTSAVEQLSRDLEVAEQGRLASADIDRLKQEMEDLIARGDLATARQTLEHLGALDVPKITIDFYSKRLEDLRRYQEDTAEAQAMTREFEGFLAAKSWQGARELAQRFGQRFPDDPRSTEMFNRVGQMEAGERRQQSVRQGLASLEQFIAQGRRQEAQLALKLLRGMDLDPGQLAELEARVRAL